MRVVRWAHTQLRFRDGALVQAIDADDQVRQILGNVKRSGPAAVNNAVRLFVVFEVRLKRETYVAGIASQIDDMLRSFDPANGKIVFTGKLFDLFDSCIIDGVGLLKFLT